MPCSAARRCNAVVMSAAGASQGANCSPLGGSAAATAASVGAQYPSRLEQQHDGATGKIVRRRGVKRFVRDDAPVVRRVDQHAPAPRTVVAGQMELDRVVIGVEQQKDVIVTQRLSTRIRFAEGIASQQHAETSCKVLVPFD